MGLWISILCSRQESKKSHHRARLELIWNWFVPVPACMFPFHMFVFKFSRKLWITHRITVMDPKHWILTYFSKAHYLLSADYFDKNFWKCLLTALEHKLVDYTLQIRSLKFLEKLSLGSFCFKIDYTKKFPRKFKCREIIQQIFAPRSLKNFKSGTSTLL